MPINRRYPLAELTSACAYYIAQKGKIITLEYILIAEVNDWANQAKPLADLAHRLNAKVNLIPYNDVEGLNWKRPGDRPRKLFWPHWKSRGSSSHCAGRKAMTSMRLAASCA